MVQSKFQHLWPHQTQLTLSSLKWDSCLSRVRPLFPPRLPGIWVVVDAFLLWGYCACPCHLGRFSSWHNCGGGPREEDEKIPSLRLLNTVWIEELWLQLGLSWAVTTKPNKFFCAKREQHQVSVSWKCPKRWWKVAKPFPPFPSLAIADLSERSRDTLFNS